MPWEAAIPLKLRLREPGVFSTWQMSFHLRTIGSSDRIPAKLIRTSDSEVVNQHAFIPSKSGSSFIFVFACNSCSCLSCAAQGLVYESLSSVHKPPTQLKRSFEPNGAQNIGAWAQGSRAAGDRSGTRHRDPAGPHSRALSDRRCHRQMGHHDPGGNAEVSGRSRLADEVDARFARLEEAWPGRRLLFGDQRQDCLFRRSSAYLIRSCAADRRLCRCLWNRPLTKISRLYPKQTPRPLHLGWPQCF